MAVEFSVEKNADPNVTIELDENQAGVWQRLGDLRLGAPQHQELLAVGASLTTTDQRLLNPGNYRVAIDGVDGRTAVSEPFTVPALR